MIVRLLVASCLLPLCSLPLGAADAQQRKITIATWNVEWLFDDYQGDNFSELAKEKSAPSREAWEWRRKVLAAAIANLQPTILALQEIEGSRVAYELTKQLKEQHNLKYRYAYIRGGDYFTEQDVALLYREGLVQYARREQTDEMYRSGDYYNVQKHLLADFQWGDGERVQRLKLLNFHLRARPEGAKFRVRQARLLHHWVREAVARGDKVVLLGDTNSEIPAGEEQATDDIGILRGLHTAGAADDLYDLHRDLPLAQRGTHLLPGKQFDRILVSPALREDARRQGDLVFRHITRRKDLCVRGAADTDHWDVNYYDIAEDERDISDHYPLVAEFEFSDK